MIHRIVTVNDFQLGEWGIPKGSILGISSMTGAINQSIWNTGSEDDPHPLDKFWEERFLIYPDRPTSGPVRKKDGVSVSHEQESRESGSIGEQESNEPIFSTKGLNGTYLAFGGGNEMCPGRHFARQEAFCIVAKLVLEYDIELLVPPNWEPKMDFRYFPLGTLPPVEEVPFRIRRRLP
jgi:cytochrome P450